MHLWFESRHLYRVTCSLALELPWCIGKRVGSLGFKSAVPYSLYIGCIAISSNRKLVFAFLKFVIRQVWCQDVIYRVQTAVRPPVFRSSLCWILHARVPNDGNLGL